VAILLGFAATAASDGCIECHGNEDFYARFPRLYNYYQDWIESPHSQAGVTCDDCHGGDASGKAIENAHAGIFPVHDSRSSLYFSRQPATCGACHTDKQAEFERSKHFKALKAESTAAPTCTTCHPAMNKRPSYQTIVLNACTTCHQDGNRQDLPPVVDDAEDLLRQINVAKGLIGWAKLHFSSHDWPGDSREQFRELERRYEQVVDQVHRFDLEASDVATLDLLTELRQLFDAERRGAGDSPTG
jgi:hypothetical protein